ncbi:MAG: (d)CMP kinase [Acidobacteriota bacterium]|nr:(d)CMP kinase [Acidobacteriota bacterium]
MEIVAEFQKLTIAIDGPAGSGKSTAAKRVAELLGYDYIDTGAMYRTVGLAALSAGARLDDASRVEQIARQAQIELRWSDGRTRVWLDGREVSEEIRRAEAAQAASVVSTVPGVRTILVRRQKEFAARGGVVMEGRDIGTVVLPQADLKIFLTASPEVRARRRADEMAGRGEAVDYEQMKEEVVERDRRDTERAASPLAAAEHAVIVDSTAMDAEEVARLIVLLAREKERRIGKEKPTFSA